MYLFKIQKKRLWEQGIGFVEEYRTEEKTILKKKLQYKLNLSEINDKKIEESTRKLEVLKSTSGFFIL